MVMPSLPNHGIGTIYEDVTTEVLGTIGAWQWFVALISGVVMLPTIFNGYEDMFLLSPLKGIVCIPPEQYVVVNGSLCTAVAVSDAADAHCSKWHVMLFWMIWIKKSWVVFCDSKIKLLSTTMISRVGLMFGCVTFGVIADTVGRRIAIMVGIFAQLGLGSVVTFCDSQPWFQLLMFLKSLSGGGTLFMGIVLACEVSSNRWRTRLIAIASVTRILTMSLIVPFTDIVPNLETLSFMSTLFNMLLLILLRWIPESPQWLLFSRKIKRAERVLFNAAKTNGHTLCSQFKIRPINHRAYSCLDENRTCAEMLSTYNIRVIILVTILSWCLFSFQWSYLYAKVYADDPNRSLMLLLCFIIIFAMLTMLLSRKLLLKQLLLFHVLLFGVSASIEIWIGHITTPPLLFSSIALASGLMAYAILLNITPRLFAIKIRATLLGCCHATGQLGTMVSYILVVLQPLNNIAYFATEIGVTLSMTTLCLVLLDVDGRELPDVVDDMDYFSDLSKPLRWATQKTNSASNEEIEMRIYSFSGDTNDPRLSAERLPARRIGLIKFWKSLKRRFRNVFPLRKK